ncbi:hypothetical protein BOO71_0003946 [Deinococcus marmoris]|uniref:Uncharacterized protein n=1 Tax=Deinococcus marmoris TaxID=249408 RepID=A0A1U7P1N7_9DEIO|nr:hypothetical protein BOO71_0003946 [Deinococcus marmoris]
MVPPNFAASCSGLVARPSVGGRPGGSNRPVWAFLPSAREVIFACGGGVCQASTIPDSLFIDCPAEATVLAFASVCSPRFQEWGHGRAAGPCGSMRQMTDRRKRRPVEGGDVSRYICPESPQIRVMLWVDPSAAARFAHDALCPGRLYSLPGSAT